MDLLDTCVISAQDHAALKVTEHLKFYEVEGRNTCDGDEIGRSSIGELVRTKISKALLNF